MQPGRIITLYFIIIVMLLHTMSMPIVYLNFQANRDYIASTLCINKEKPITICGGTCYLTKNLKEAHESPESNEPIQNKKQTTETLYCSTVFDYSIQQTDLLDQSFLQYQEDIITSFPKEIFHPPKA